MNKITFEEMQEKYTKTAMRHRSLQEKEFKANGWTSEEFDDENYKRIDELFKEQRQSMTAFEKFVVWCSLWQPLRFVLDLKIKHIQRSQKKGEKNGI